MCPHIYDFVCLMNVIDLCGHKSGLVNEYRTDQQQMSLRGGTTKQTESQIAESRF